MAIALKDLTVLDSAITLTLDNEKTVSVTVHYRSGAGTLVLEGTMDDSNWVDIVTVEAGDTTETPAATMTAVGLYGATVGGLSQIRVRKSVGAAALLAGLSITEY